MKILWDLSGVNDSTLRLTCDEHSVNAISSCSPLREANPKILYGDTALRNQMDQHVRCLCVHGPSIWEVVEFWLSVWKLKSFDGMRAVIVGEQIATWT